jgi:dTDP-glucose pyrophosphorylase
MSGSEIPQKDWRKTLLPASACLREAIACLDASALQIVVVVDDNDQLRGTLTDGDIRRGLLRGLGLNEPIATIIHADPLVVPPQMDRDTVLQLMQANKIRQLPVVDEFRRVAGLHVWDELMAPRARDNILIIMAGGLGTRLRPHTENCPKPFLRIRGKPMLEHIIERASAEGFRHFVIAVHYLRHMIEDYFGDGQRWQVRIDYLREETPLGTAGALSLLEQRPAAPVVITNGDVITDVRYGELLDFHIRNRAAATMAVRPHEWQHPFGVVQTDGIEITGFDEKPVYRSHINAGIYVLEPSALDALTPGERCDMPSLFVRLKERASRTIVYPMHEPWMDVGGVEDYNRAQRDPVK